MKMTQIVLLSVAALLSSLANAQNKLDVIYGSDNRVDVYATTNPVFVTLARSTAAQIKLPGLTKTASGYDISAKSLKERGICESERFSNQMFAANCSGFLVGEDLLVTAGHCVTSMADCKSAKWVFDYKLESAKKLTISVPDSAVYECKEIIAQELNEATMQDYALVRLDRKVTDRKPLAFRKAGKPKVGDTLVVIGHPTGLPTKISDGAAIRSLKDVYFMANLDTYGGNSGSAVINTRTNTVEGILVRGDTDYVKDPAKGCMVSNVCADDKCRGEDVTYITNIKQLK